MKISTWRSSLVTWLSGSIADPDGWNLENPETTTHTQGFLPPLRDVSYEVQDDQVLLGIATQDFFVLRRYTASQYKDLPVGYLEGLYHTLSHQVWRRWSEMADLVDLDLEPVTTPVKVGESDDSSEDWIVELAWSWRIKWVIEPELPDDIPFDFKGLRVNLWRWQLDEQDKHLDYTFQKP